METGSEWIRVSSPYEYAFGPKAPDYSQTVHIRIEHNGNMAQLVHHDADGQMLSGPDDTSGKSAGLKNLHFSKTFPLPNSPRYHLVCHVLRRRRIQCP